MSCSHRHPLEARGVAVLRQRRHKMYMLSVLWSDHNNILIYRTFEEFKKFDRELRRKFPLEARFLKKSERIIPKLKDAPMFLRLKRATQGLLQRLQLLETYSCDLLCSDPKISQAPDVTQFFAPQTRDLDPSFPDDSIVIMPSEAGNRTKGAVGTDPLTPVTEPVVSQRYLCIEAYETKDTKNRPFSVSQDEMLEVLLKDTTGWWLVENRDGQLTWFPAPYLKEESCEDLDKPGDPEIGVFYYVVKGYEARNSDEMSVNIGIVLEVLEKSDNGWWLVCYNGKAGYVPSMYLKPYKTPFQEFQVLLSKASCGSTPNLQKVTGSSDMNMPPYQRASEGDKSYSSSNASGRNTTSKKCLGRKRSKSLSGLPTLAENEVRSPPPLELNTGDGKSQNLSMNWEYSPLESSDLDLTSTYSSKHEEGDNFPLSWPQERKDSGFAENSSMSDSDSSFSLSDSDSNPNTPKVPPRPEVQEILTKCSTITKRTVQLTRANPDPFTLASADQPSATGPVWKFGRAFGVDGAMNGSSSSRYPVEAKGIGVIQHHRQKMYMLSVLWSDHNNILIYRTFEEFKKFERELRRKFPLEAGFLKKSERIIPKLKDAPFIFGRNKNRHLERLHLLATFAHELFCTDPKISQAPNVTEFFTPQTRDLNPSFPEDSIVIMPSEAGDRTKGAVGTDPFTPVTEPVVSQRYLCIEAYETKDTKNRPFSVSQDEMLEVLLKDTTGWWLVENEDKQLAWFPAPYLKKYVAANESGSARACARDGDFYFSAKGYEAQSSDEVSVASGVIVEVLEKSENGWWMVWYNGKAGYVPSMYLQPYKNPYQKFQIVLNKEAYGSSSSLHKIGSSDMDALAQRRQSEGDPLYTSKANLGKKLLGRTRSRSLTGLPTVVENEDRSPQPVELGTLPVNAVGRSNQNMKMARQSPLARNEPKVERMELNLTSVRPGFEIQKELNHSPALEKQRKDSGFEENSSMSGSDASLSSSDLDSNPHTPKVPPRPKAKEILEHCSTVTKRAVQRTRAQPDLFISARAQPLV
ncbi:NADPH oxidase organizer 1 [Microcaecilia unicolor]|uniref:NADPH oxidase organizer 1 n=1 Tax=Microcaecilia unicolor TaxID=1415580 RepID=A0A6P7YK55_9AMPH|nr:NADPH oxidase organizer 1 [Microcaecilia unicolor]